ncbi:PAAR domain-containing protein [Actinokineospora bangkokensis]|uniref:PAAR motif protein n=1 Tax=Actinokineospora bangkokensis TaxID=1193682 RepID=A0A1Q9LLG3_9PSEU|nr:PAAR domain-containing protein [Actinokineospora bangkokensis]OLR92876.1 hypothetical protein BJP25_19315 [Actinokineospora bangkokensis]
MGAPAAKLGDQVLATDTHIVLVPSPGGPVPTPVPLPFTGKILGGCSANVLVEGKPAAVLGSTAQNLPPHVPPAPATFQVPPTDQATIVQGSATVLVNGKPAARAGDKAQTCNDPAPLPVGTVQATGTVLIGP